jgi:hypothetical protein
MVHADSAMAPQTVSYLPARPAIILSKGASERIREQRNRTYVVVRGVLVSFGITLACALASVLWYWRSHIQVEIESPVLPIVEGALKIEVRTQAPDSNTDELLETDELTPGSTLRIRLPSDDLLFIVRGTFRDGKRRALRFQVVSQPTFSAASKFLHFALPSDDAIHSHPNMAYVPPTIWLSGPDRTPTKNDVGYWIDMYPPTVSRDLTFKLSKR